MTITSYLVEKKSYKLHFEGLSGFMDPTHFGFCPGFWEAINHINSVFTKKNNLKSENTVALSV